MFHGVKDLMNSFHFLNKLRHLKKRIKFSSFKFLNFLVYKTIQKKKSKNINKIKTILIFGYTGIGNLILYTPALKLLRKKFPRAKIIFQYGNNNNCEKIIKKSNLIDEFLEISIKDSLINFAKYGFKMRNNIDLVLLDFHIDKLPFLLELLLINPAIIIGNDRIDNFPFLSDFKIPIQTKDHEIDIYLDLLSPLNIEFIRKNEYGNTEVFIENSNNIFATDILNSLPENKKNIGIQIGTNIKMNWKQWPVDYFISLIKMMRTLHINIILLGSPSEKIMIDDLIEKNDLDFVHNLAGCGSLLDSCALISKLDFMITNDSGLMHVSNAFKTPLLAIYGPTNSLRTMPLENTSKIIKHNYDCIPCFEFELKPCHYNRKCLKKLTPDIIFRKLTEYLQFYNVVK